MKREAMVTKSKSSGYMIPAMVLTEAADTVM
jgi:hypothetical protein